MHFLPISRGHRLQFLKYIGFLFLKAVIISGNCADPDKMSNYLSISSGSTVFINVPFMAFLWPLVKSAYQKFYFLISQLKYMLWVLKTHV